MRHRDLVLYTKTKKDTIIWLLNCGYLKNEAFCIKCNGILMKLQFRNETARFFCMRCSNSRSVFHNTIFYDSKKSIIELVDLIYFWSLDLIQPKVAFQINTLSHSTLNNWFSKLCSLAGRIIRLENPSGRIGGPGHWVQLDESKFSKRKFEVGRAVRSPWIVGGIDMTTKECFFVETFYRDAETLRSIIMNHVVEGSVLCTDCWRGYSNLESLGFTHFTVNHSRFFVDPITGINTQLIENTWSIYKRKFRARGINYSCKINEYFLEFMLKLKYGNRVFTVIMENIYLIE